MSQQNLALARRWFEEVWNQRRDATIDELLTPESVCYSDDGPIRGPDEFRQRMYAPFLAAFPDLRVTVEGVVAEGDDVVVRWSATGCHSARGWAARRPGRRPRSAVSPGSRPATANCPKAGSTRTSPRSSATSPRRPPPDRGVDPITSVLSGRRSRRRRSGTNGPRAEQA